MFPPFVDFAEKVRLFEAHFVQNADIIHRRFRLVNRRDKLFFTAFGCVRLKTLTRQKQISTVLFRDVFPAIFFIRMCPASKKQRGLPGFHRKGEHEVIDPLCGRLYADTLLIFFRRTTLIISKKPGNTGISRDIRTEFTTDLLLSD